MIYLLKNIEVFDGSFPSCFICGIYSNIEDARIKMREVWDEENGNMSETSELNRIYSDINGDLVSVEILSIEVNSDININMFDGI